MFSIAKNQVGLTREGDLLLLCARLRLLSDQKMELGEICDLAEVTNYYNDEIDWQSMSQEVIANGLRGPVYCGLSLAQQLLDAPAPEQFLDTIRPPEFDTASAQFFNPLDLWREVQVDRWIHSVSLGEATFPWSGRIKTRKRSLLNS